MPSTRFRFAFAPTLVGLALSLVGCGGAGDTTTPSSDDPAAAFGGDGSTQGTSDAALTLRGRVMPGTIAAPASSQRMAVYEVKSGSIDDGGDGDELSDCGCAPDEDGFFELPLIDLPAGNGPVAVVVEVDGEIAAGVIVYVDGDGAIDVPPITAETSLELEVAIGAGGTPQAHALAQLLIDAQLAAAVSSSADADQDVAICADAVLAASVAFETAIQQGAEGEVAIDVAAEAIAEAQATLQASLATAETQAEVDAALSVFAEAFVDAYEAAGCTSTDVLVAIQAAVDAFLQVATEIGADAEVSAALHVCQLIADQAQLHFETELSAMGVSQASLDLLAQAHATLKAELDAAASLGAEAHAQIAAAFSAYVQTCQEILEAEIAGATSLTFDLVTSTIADLAAELKATVDSCTGTAEEVGETIAQAHLDYQAAVTAQTSLDAVTSAALDVDALLEVMGELALLDGYCGKKDR